MAGYDVDRYPDILRWPVAEALAAYEHHLRQHAQHGHDLNTLIWAVLAQSGATKKKKAPELPAILK